MIIDPHAYWHDDRAHEIADRVLADAGVSPHETSEIWLDEGGVVITRLRVVDARMMRDGKPCLTFKLDQHGHVESYRTVKTRHGWVNVECDGQPMPAWTMR